MNPTSSFENMEPLLVDKNGDLESTNTGEASKHNPTVINEEERNEEEDKSSQTTSRLRGTSRLLMLAGSELLYLWVGIAVLLVRLP